MSRKKLKTPGIGQIWTDHDEVNCTHHRFPSCGVLEYYINAFWNFLLSRRRNKHALSLCVMNRSRLIFDINRRWPHATRQVCSAWKRNFVVGCWHRSLSESGACCYNFLSDKPRTSSVFGAVRSTAICICRANWTLQIECWNPHRFSALEHALRSRPTRTRWRN